MKSSFGVPQLRKWPFLIGYFLLIALALGTLHTKNYQPVGWDWVVIIVCFALGIFFGGLPFLTEFLESSRRFEATEFRSTLEQIRQLEKVGGLISTSMSQWKEVHERCDEVVKVAEKIAVQTRSERERLDQITEKANAQEREHLRLEVEKRRRDEREWLEVLVGIMDHIFALHRAAVRSGQVKLIQQIEDFQTACQEICRRVGLSQYLANVGETFDPQIHKVLDGIDIPSSAVIAENLACGFRYQGHPIRLPMVRLSEASNDQKDQYDHNQNDDRENHESHNDRSD